MAVSLAVIQADVAGLLNAGTPGSYSTVISNPMWTTQQVVDIILSADGRTVDAYIKNPTNARAQLYYTTQTGLAHGGTILNSAGPIIAVQFTITGGTAPGVRPSQDMSYQGWDLAEIQNEIVNPLGLTLIEPHHIIQGRKIWHNGATIAANSGGGSVSVDVTFPAYTRTSACQAPDEAYWTVLCGAMAGLIPFEGENMSAFGGWSGLFEKGLAAAEAGEAPPAELREAVERARAA